LAHFVFADTAAELVAGVAFTYRVHSLVVLAGIRLIPSRASMAACPTGRAETCRATTPADGSACPVMFQYAWAARTAVHGSALSRPSLTRGAHVTAAGPSWPSRGTMCFAHCG